MQTTRFLRVVLLEHLQLIRSPPSRASAVLQQRSMKCSNISEICRTHFGDDSSPAVVSLDLGPGTLPADIYLASVFYVANEA